MSVLDKLRPQPTADELRARRDTHRKEAQRATTAATERRAFARTTDDAEAARKALADARTLEQTAADENDLASSYEAKIADAVARAEKARIDQAAAKDAALAKQEAEAATVAHRALAKAVGPLTALQSIRSSRSELAVVLRDHGREPAVGGEINLRSVPGSVETARYENRVVWRKYPGGPEVCMFTQNKAGEMVPTDAGGVRSVEKVLVSPEREISARFAKPLVEAVVIPGFKADDPPLWPVRGAR